MATKTLKGGYDCEFVTKPPWNLECSICLLTLRDPHVTSCCGNHFCHHCISLVLEDKRPCPLCNETSFTTLLHKGVQREVKGQIVYCRWRRLGCEWQGKLGEHEDHLNPTAGLDKSGCGFVLVECGNKCGEMVERRQLAGHELEDCPKRSVEVQMSSLTKKLESRLAVVESKLEGVAKDREETRDKLDKIEEENKTLMSQNKTLMEENKVLMEKNKTLMEENSEFKRELEAVKRTVLPIGDTPPFYYTVYNYNHYKKYDLVLFSPSFYSHPGGYKLRLQLYPNGTRHAKNTALSLFVAIMAGENDVALKWPFSGVVTVEIYNCVNEEWDMNTDFRLVPKGNNRCVQRPVDCLGNDGSGQVTWVSHDDMSKYYMIPGFDFVRFRVKEVKLFV